MYPFTLRNLIGPREHYIWAQVRILHETAKAILVTAPHVIASPEGARQSQENDNIKIWIPKSRICGVRLRNNVFEVYVKESIIG